MTDMERLAIAQAVYKMVADAISTKDPDSIRGRCDAGMMDAYAADGTKSRDLRIGGEKVGTYTVRTAKAVHGSRIDVTDEDAYYAWADENGLMKAVVDAAAVQAWMDETGEVPDGCASVTTDVPEHATGTTLRVDVEKVVDAMHGQLDGVRALMLGDGVGRG